MIEVLWRVSTGTTSRILFQTDSVKKSVAMAAKTGKLTANRARKEQLLRKDFGYLVV